MSFYQNGEKKGDELIDGLGGARAIYNLVYRQYSVAYFQSSFQRKGGNRFAKVI